MNSKKQVMMIWNLPLILFITSLLSMKRLLLQTFVNHPIHIYGNLFLKQQKEVLKTTHHSLHLHLHPVGI